MPCAAWPVYLEALTSDVTYSYHLGSERREVPGLVYLLKSRRCSPSAYLPWPQDLHLGKA